VIDSIRECIKAIEEYNDNSIEEVIFYLQHIAKHLSPVLKDEILDIVSELCLPVFDASSIIDRLNLIEEK